MAGKGKSKNRHAASAAFLHEIIQVWMLKK